jgi:hypothetical protein
MKMSSETNSRFTLEERAAIIRKERSEANSNHVVFSLVQPFPQFEAMFSVRGNLRKFLVNDEDVQQHRQQWKGTPWESQTIEEETNVRFKAAKLIEAIGAQLSA